MNIQTKKVPVTAPKAIKVRLAPKQTGVTISEARTAIAEVNRAINQWLYS